MVDSVSFNESRTDVALSQSGKTEDAAKAHSSFVDDAIHIAQNSIVAPALNAAWVEPRNTVAHIVNAVTDEKFGKIEDQKAFAVEHAKPYSAEWFLQSASGGIGSLVPYTIAGKATGGLMRAGGERMGLTGAAAAFAKNEQLAFVGGAFAYDGLRPTKEGETHLGNALAGAAGFAVFGAGNRYLNFDNQVAKFAGRAATGALGADAATLVSVGVSQNRLATGDELAQSAVSGAAMNFVLPTVQDRVDRSITNLQLNTTRGAALDRYLSTAHSLNLSQSPELMRLNSENPWARVKLTDGSADFHSSANKISLPHDGQAPTTIAKELTHLSDARSGKFESGFATAANKLAAGDVEGAYQAYKNTRSVQETAAETSSQVVSNNLSGTRVLDPNLLNMEISAWPSGREMSQEMRWRQEFSQFQESGGTWRPGTELSAKEAFQPADTKQPDVTKLSGEEQAKLREQTIGTSLAEDLQKAGYIGVFAGGSVRDGAMGKVAKDFDIATSAPPEAVERLFTDKGYKVIATGKKFGVINVVANGSQFEIATLRTDGKYVDGRRPESVEFVSSLHEDAARRDLTINSMFKDPVSSNTYDFYNGRGDIANKIIRAVGDPNQRFAEDHLRMMRVPRFAARYAKEGFTVDPATLDAITANAPDINKVAGERIRDEIKGILKTDSPVAGLDVMMETGLMKQVLPEVVEMNGPRGDQDARWHPEGNTWKHTRMVVDNLAQVPYNFELRLAGLLHDIGKPDTQTHYADGGIGNPGHDALGAKMFDSIADRFRLSNKERAEIKHLIDWHMHMHKVHKWELPRLMDVLADPRIHNMTELEHADAMGRGHTVQAAYSNRDFIANKIAELSNHENPTQRLGAKPIVDGALLKKYGVKPEQYNALKLEAYDAQRLGVFSDRQGAMEWFLKTHPEFGTNK